MMLLSLLFGSASAAILNYNSDGSGHLAALELEWKNPDFSGDTKKTNHDKITVYTATGIEMVDFDLGKLVDGDEYSYQKLENPSGTTNWGLDTPPNGAQGLNLTATGTVGTDSGIVYWVIDEAKIVLSGNINCFGPGKVGTLFYTEYPSGTRRTVTATMSSQNQLHTFAVTGPLHTASTIGFEVQTNSECSETEIYINEFELKGVAVSTPSPTHSPTRSPSERPTKAPTKQCNGLITWGDPHYHPMAIDNKEVRFDYQGMGWYYYMAPCEMDDYEEWPIFLLGFHEPWNNPKASVMGDNVIVINTKPEPWIIQFEQNHWKKKKSWLYVTQGSGAAAGFNFDNDFSKLKNYDKKDPFEIVYDDGQGTSGVLKIYEGDKNGDKKIYFDFEDLSYEKGAQSCDGHQFELTQEGYYYYISCPICLRNHACGIMGRYTRGDCDKKDMEDKNDECHNILVDAKGTAHTPEMYGKKKFDNTVFGEFAKTWGKDDYEKAVQNAGHDVIDITLLKNDKQLDHQSDPRMDGDDQGEDAIDTDGEGNLVFTGVCADTARKDEIDVLCHANTLEKYEKCCKEIGICQELYTTCIWDVCECTGVTDDEGEVFDDERCIEMIVHQSMNNTCTTAALFPTASPTAAPTKSPTRTVVRINDDNEQKEKVSKVQKLIGIYSIFVVLFLVIAIGSFCYYKKRNKGTAYFHEEDAHAMTGATV